MKKMEIRKFTESEMAIREHNAKLMKFILVILFGIIIIFCAAWYYNNQDVINIVSGGALSVALVALWIMKHHPEFLVKR